MYPPALGLTPRVVSKGGLDLYGKFIPEGMEVTSMPWIINRDMGVYGSDVDVFRPERWLDDGDEKIKAYNKAFFTFSYGPRACLGKELALLELYKAGLMVGRLIFPHSFLILRNLVEDLYVDGEY